MSDLKGEDDAARQMKETRAQRRRRKKREAHGRALIEPHALSQEDIAKHLAIGICMPFRLALQASLVTIMTTWAAHQNRSAFRWHPGNTLPHSALTALEERSTVEVYEWLCKAGKTLNVSLSMRAHWTELRNHRDYASHVRSLDEWDRFEMREFVQEGRHVHVKTVEIWRATTVIRGLLRPEDQHLLPREVPLDYNMAVMVDAIYRSSMTPEGFVHIPPIPAIFEGLKPAAVKYVADLERRASDLDADGKG